MRINHLLRVLLIALFSTLVAAPLVVAAEQTDETVNPQAITISDTRTGSGPCGFPIQRDLEGTASIVTRIDDAGNLVLAIDEVTLYGTLTNPANNKSAEIRWVQQNGNVSLAANGSSTSVLLGLTGTFFRGYDTADSDLTMDLPHDGADTIAFTPGERSLEPWAHICGLLADIDA